ncbi:MAG: hypothetical protein EOP48_16955, partial [Sphingobacteriales bacterium]
MTLIEFIGLLGSAFSIGSAYYAYKQAMQAKGYSERTEEIKAELITYRANSELSEFKPILISARDAMDKYCTESLEGLSGVDKVEDAKLVQKVINILSGFRSHFQQETVATFTENISKDLHKFVDSNNPQVIKRSGRVIHREITNLYNLLSEKIKEQQAAILTKITKT